MQTAVLIVATVVSVFSAVISIKSNRVSVRPALAVWRARHQKIAGRYVYRINNRGKGPAFIGQMRLFVDGNAVSGLPTEIVRNALYELFGGKEKVDVHYFSTFVRGQPFGTEEERLLADFTVKADKVGSVESGEEKDRLNVESLINRLRLEIDYKDMYGARWRASIEQYSNVVTRLFRTHAIDHQGGGARHCLRRLKNFAEDLKIYLLS